MIKPRGDGAITEQVLSASRRMAAEARAQTIIGKFHRVTMNDARMIDAVIRKARDLGLAIVILADDPERSIVVELNPSPERRPDRIILENAVADLGLVLGLTEVKRSENAKIASATQHFLIAGVTIGKIVAIIAQ